MNGCVARKSKEETERAGSFSSFLDCHSKECGNQGHLSSHIPFFHPLHLPFPQHVYDLDALECLPGHLEREKAHSQFCQPFDEAVILFTKGIEVFDLP